ncbi:rRNA pseudouridine synthase [bacterium]|nr:rRNA pseudouridine synthase [bacterium]
MDSPDEGIRLQKVLAQAGIASRRAAEALIAEGRVSVDGQTVTELGTRVDPASAVIHVDGERVPTAPGLVVVAMNKPRGVVTAMSDDRGRECVGDLVADREERLFHVGRLDADTEGLLLLTNDGGLANRLGHPSHEVAKTYRATVRGSISKQAIRDLGTGVELEDGPIACDKIRVIQRVPDRSLVEVVLHSGRNRIVRRMLDFVGYPVIDLVRTDIGPISLGGVKPGLVRDIEGAELRALYTAVGM